MAKAYGAGEGKGTPGLAWTGSAPSSPRPWQLPPHPPFCSTSGKTSRSPSEPQSPMCFPVLALSALWCDSEREAAAQRQSERPLVCLRGGGAGKRGQAGGWVRPEGVPFLEHGMSFPDGTGWCSLTLPSPGLWLIISPCLCLVLGVTLDDLALPAMMPSLSSIG